MRLADSVGGRREWLWRRGREAAAVVLLSRVCASASGAASTPDVIGCEERSCVFLYPRKNRLRPQIRSGLKLNLENMRAPFSGDTLCELHSLLVLLSFPSYSDSWLADAHVSTGPTWPICAGRPSLVSVITRNSPRLSRRLKGVANVA